MENIWSENKYVNITINVLLFLFATNFLHFGYLLLPIVCCILLIDNKFSFKVNNNKIFILLCLFGLSFFVFSYKLGFYSLIGLFFPIAYYIGSNIKTINEKNIKSLIYILMFGMCTHVLLNFGYELIERGIETFTRNSHLDFWIMDEVPTTQTSVNYIFLLALTYYMFAYEKNIKIKRVYSIVFILLMLYEIGLARRTTVLMLIISLFISFIFDKKVNNGNNELIKKILLIMVIISLFGFIYFKFLYNPWANRKSLQIFNKFFFAGLSSNRIGIFIEAIKIAPQHLWGGQEISTLFDINVHDLWMDTYDYAGIMPYVLLITYSIYCLINIIKVLKNKELTKSYKLLIFVLFVCITIQMFLEPIITGSPIFLLSSIIVVTTIECLTLNK